LVHGKAQLAGNGHSLMSKALFKSCNASVGQMTNDSLVVFGCFTTLAND